MTGLSVGASPASAETNNPNTAAGGQNTYFAYVGAGEHFAARFTVSTASALGENFSLRDPAGAVRWTCAIPVNAPVGTSCTAPAGLTGPAGVWTLTTTGTGTPFPNWVEGSGAQTSWTINAMTAANVAIPGRVWIKQYRAYSAASPATANLAFWVVSENGAQYKVDVPGFNGGGWSFSSDAFGNVVPAGSCTPAYKSLVNTINTPEHPSPGAQCGPGYNLFLTAPAADLPATALSAAGTVFVKPTYVAPTLTGTTYAQATALSHAGTLNYNLNNFTGNYVVRIDTNGNGLYTDPEDLAIPQSGTNGAKSYAWNGLDANGNPVDACTPVNFKAAIEKTDEIHFVLGDVETLSGIRITQLQGSDVGNDTIYWDDTDVPQSGGTAKTSTTTPVVNLNGLSSANGTTHGWPFVGGNPWGNFASVDNWTYSDVDITGEATAPGNCLSLTKTSDATADTRVGDDVTYTVTATNEGASDYTSARPAVISDDLTGVLDDATFNNDAAADKPGTVSYTAPKLSWSGPLVAGATVELTYTVTATRGGDGTARNVAYSGPPTATTPACDPPNGDGEDPATGIACAETTFELPRLTIQKSADATDIPAVGGQVTYTVTVKNEGPGDFTAGAPAVMTDDLSGVLDDATFNGDAASTVGAAPGFTAPNLTWSGALIAGATATLTYSVTYTGAGNSELANTACVPLSDTLPGAAPCDSVTIPAANLQQWKTVQASDTPLRAGSTLAYTLHFQNTGLAAATVDATDALQHLLDDADVTTEPTSSSSDLSAPRNGSTINITGTVAPGTTTTITYTVTVKPDGQRGDNIASNFLLQPGDTPPTGPDCVPADGQLPDCTTNLISELQVAKSVDPASGTTVAGGQTLTYTLTFTNVGKAAATTDYTDDISGVLDDGDITTQPAASVRTLTASPVSSGAFTVTGTVNSGSTITVTYTVVVKADGQRGDNVLGNFLFPTGTTPPTDCQPGNTLCTLNPVPEIAIAKSVNPASGTTVTAGETLTYTLTFANNGAAAGMVNHTDMVADVLDDATVTQQPGASAAVLAASPIANGSFAVTGTLAPGVTVTVSYQVTVNPDGSRGNNTLGNFLFPTGSVPPTGCDPASTACTVNAVPEIREWKTVAPASSTPVVPGQVLTYTLHFTNVGAATGTVDAVDDLTQAIDDAIVTEQPSASTADLTATPFGADNRSHIIGSLAAGAVVTVSYELTVHPSGSLGDGVVANFLLKPGDPSPTGPDCDPTDAQLPDCTVNPVGDLIVSKVVDPSKGTSVHPGDTLTYTLSFENVGSGAAKVDYADTIAGVLDDATVTEQPAASNTALNASTITDGAFSVTGSLAAAQKVTVTYSVKTKPFHEQGDHILANYLDPIGTTPDTSCVAEDPLCTTNPVIPPVSIPMIPPAPGIELAYTGSDATPLAIIGGILIALGAAVAGVAGLRRRRSV